MNFKRFLWRLVTIVARGGYISYNSLFSPPLRIEERGISNLMICKKCAIVIWLNDKIRKICTESSMKLIWPFRYTFERSTPQWNFNHQLSGWSLLKTILKNFKIEFYFFNFFNDLFNYYTTVMYMRMSRGK